MFAANPTFSTAATTDAIRPVLVSTFRGGKLKRRGTKRHARGGFYPSVMGSFVANAQSVVAPAAMMTAYRTMNKSTSRKKSRKHRKSTRRHRI
jgi:hypothetical protein